MQIYGGRVEGVSFNLGEDPEGAMEGVSGGAEVVGCRITLVSPRHAMVFCATVTNSVIHARKKATRLHLSSAHFRGCTFTGRYYDTRFGLTSDDADICTRAGGLADCDFSGAGLHLCTFHNCDPATIRFPRWPHFTVLHPSRNSGDWLSISFPASFRHVQKSITYCDDRELAITLHWPTFAKKEKDTTDPEAIRQLLVGKDYVVM